MSQTLPSNTLAKPERQMGIDLLRVVSMFMVVLLHVVGRGWVLSAKPLSPTWHAGWIIEYLCYGAVNIFALITGYVACKSTKIKYARTFELWFQGLFYSVLITLYFALFTDVWQGLGVGTNVIRSFFPVATNQYWYLTAYFGYVFFIPFFNRLIERLNKKQFGLLVALILIIFSVTAVFPETMNEPFNTERGFSALWLAALYFVGAYLRLYPPKTSKLRQLGCIVIFAASSLIQWFYRAGIAFLQKHHAGWANSENGKLFFKYFAGELLHRYTSPFMVIAAVSLLIFFANLKIKNSAARRAIKFAAPISFGVYLIHMHLQIYRVLIQDKFKDYADLPNWQAVAYSLLTAAVIFTVCLFADEIRLLLFKLLHVRQLCDWLDKRLRQLAQRVLKTKQTRRS
ncbi:MAG: acyltransferase [Oscillospiraceae bacterium]|jgi:surface polysaccharide O-acyltransferase-like enzyme|nr:acyltransferase [Oscillospiraceae bacterium]